MISLAFSAIMIVVAFIFALGSDGITDASTMRKLPKPFTFSSGLTTALEYLSNGRAKGKVIVKVVD